MRHELISSHSPPGQERALPPVRVSLSRRYLIFTVCVFYFFCFGGVFFGLFLLLFLVTPLIFFVCFHLSNTLLTLNFGPCVHFLSSF